MAERILVSQSEASTQIWAIQPILLLLFHYQAYQYTYFFTIESDRENLEVYYPNIFFQIFNVLRT